MAQWFTDFTEYTTGAAPSDWTERWVTTAAAPTVQASGLPSGAINAKALKIVPSAASRYALSWDDPGAPSGDVEIIAHVLLNNASDIDNALRLLVQGSGTSGAESAYFASVQLSTNFIRLDKYVSNTATFLDQASFVLNHDTWFWVRVRRDGTAIRAAIATGANPPDGTTWDVEVTDTSLSSGWVGVGMASSTGTLWCDQFSVGTAGDSAPTAPVLISVSKVITNTLGFVDSLARKGVSKRVFTNTLGLGETTPRHGTRKTTFNNTLGLADTQARHGVAKRNLSNTLGLVETAVRRRSIGRAIAETLGLADSRARVLRSLRSISHTLGLSDSANTRAGSGRVVSNTLGLSDALARRTAVKLAIANTLGLAESLARKGVSKRVFNNTLGLVSTLARKGVSRRAVTSTLGLVSDSARAAVSKRIVNATFGLAETPARVLRLRRVITSTLGLASTARQVPRISRSVTATLGIVADQASAFGHVARGLRIKVGAMSYRVARYAASVASRASSEE